MWHLQEIQDKYGDRGLVLLGMNASDARDIALAELQRNNVRFVNIVDSSPAAQKVNFEQYKTSGVPLNYIIDKEGKVVDAWYGNEDDFARAMKAIRTAGIKEARPLATKPAAEPPK